MNSYWLFMSFCSYLPLGVLFISWQEAVMETPTLRPNCYCLSLELTLGRQQQWKFPTYRTFKVLCNIAVFNKCIYYFICFLAQFLVLKSHFKLRWTNHSWCCSCKPDTQQCIGCDAGSREGGPLPKRLWFDPWLLKSAFRSGQYTESRISPVKRFEWSKTPDNTYINNSVSIPLIMLFYLYLLPGI